MLRVELDIRLYCQCGQVAGDFAINGVGVGVKTTPFEPAAGGRVVRQRQDAVEWFGICVSEFQPDPHYSCEVLGCVICACFYFVGEVETPSVAGSGGEASYPCGAGIRDCQVCWFA
jgi:hypothetical protein